MSFTSPILLLTLLPWLAVALWLLWSRRAHINVPFLDLWRTADQAKRTSRRFAPPPLPLAAALFAALLALLAAAGPRVHFAGAAERTMVTIILDRGITMSPLDRRAETIGSAAAMLFQPFGAGP